MLTALTIKNITEEKRYKKLLNKIKGNKIQTEIIEVESVSMKFVTYLNRTGQINWRRLDSVIGNQRNHLLCNKDVLLPKTLGFKRFDNREYKIRLASNFFIHILSQLNKKDLQVALYDPKGRSTEVLPYIVKYVANPVVVSDNLTAFNCEINNIYQEYGATIQLTNNRSNLSECKFVLALDEISESLPLAGDVVVISISKPTVSVSGVVYYDFTFMMPREFLDFKTSEFSEEYLCGALYTKANKYELGSVVPLTCSNESATQTCKSICKYLKKHHNSDNKNNRAEK